MDARACLAVGGGLACTLAAAGCLRLPIARGSGAPVNTWKPPSPAAARRPQFAQDVGEAAHGGQVLMTHDAWVELAKDMASAGWPVVQLLGLFHVRGAGWGGREGVGVDGARLRWPKIRGLLAAAHMHHGGRQASPGCAHAPAPTHRPARARLQLPSCPAPAWLYQLGEAIGKPLPRAFPPPRKIRMEWPEVSGKVRGACGKRREEPFPKKVCGSACVLVFAALAPPCVRLAPWTKHARMHRRAARPAQVLVRWRLSICGPPPLNADGALAFVAARITTKHERVGAVRRVAPSVNCAYVCTPTNPSSPRLSLRTLGWPTPLDAHVTPAPRPPQKSAEVHPAMQTRFEEITLMQAQQFRGYCFAGDGGSREGMILLAFSEAMDAVRFCHAAQMLYMCVRGWVGARAARGRAYHARCPSPTPRWHALPHAVHTTPLGVHTTPPPPGTPRGRQRRTSTLAASCPPPTGAGCSRGRASRWASTWGPSSL